MNSSDVGDYTPIPAEGITGSVGSPGAPGPEGEEGYSVPAAQVREVSHQQEPAREPYRYVVRAAPPSFHIYEETTGKRITRVAVTDQHEAQERASVWTRLQSPP